MYFLDSCICIDFMRGKLPAMYEFLQKNDPRLFKIPAIVEAELYLGAEKSKNPKANRLLVSQFMLPFETMSFDTLAAKEHALIRSQLEAKGERIGPNDLLIAAIARSHNATLVTHNVKEFERVKGLKLEDWDEVDL